jgi:predicted nucleic acid-binding protein
LTSTLYLADTSIWSWADKDPSSRLARRLVERLEAGEIATCAVVVLELMHRARDRDEYRRLRSDFCELHDAPVSEAASARAVEVQQGLSEAGPGNHRRAATDFLIAAAAELADESITLWFLDKDLRVICEHTGQPYEAEKRA